MTYPHVISHYDRAGKPVVIERCDATMHTEHARRLINVRKQMGFFGVSGADWS